MDAQVPGCGDSSVSGMPAAAFCTTGMAVATTCSTRRTPECHIEGRLGVGVGMGQVGHLAAAYWRFTEKQYQARLRTAHDACWADAASTSLAAAWCLICPTTQSKGRKGSPA